VGLPADFEDTLTKVDRLGIKEQDPALIRDHLILSIRTAAQQGNLKVDDLGFIDWSLRTLKKCEDALHGELCDGQGLKQEYKNLASKQMTDDGVRSIATIVTSVLATINPTLVVSSVVVYFALWIAKVGLDYWCKQPVGN
jgi:hypothetical protein